MKNKGLTLLLVLISQVLVSQTITLQPNATDGIDAQILDDDPNTNFGNSVEFIAFYWTRSGHDYEGRSLLKFDLSSLPAGKTIVSAKLSLYWDQLASAGQSGDNDAKLSKITSTWDENTVTWNNKPTVSSSEYILLPKSTSATQDYTDIDVTSMVNSMYNNPSSNFGFQIEQVVKSTYRSMKFASSDHTVASKRPKLVITLGSVCENQISLRPGPNDGIDAGLQENNPTTNKGSDDEFITYDWSFGGTESKGVSLIKFDLSSLPSNINIVNAKLDLFYNPTSSSAGQYGDNTSYLKRITTSWDESTVTWNTKPTTTDVGKVTIAASTSATQNHLDIDVTSLITTMFLNPSSNYGMMLQLANTGIYRSMKFCSSDYIDSTMRPRLKICYSISSGISSINDNINKKIYPNPSNSVIYLNGFNVGSQYSLTNSVGVEIMSGNLIDNTIDIRNLAKGIYFFRVENTTQTVVIN